jgi:D-serine deaminase-like pyridoxal phosphate-dependent protein
MTLSTLEVPSDLDWLIGRPVEDVPTPALVVDLDAFDRNAQAIREDLQSHGVGWRPHVKAHVNASLAKRQIELGAIGATCATASEAATLALGGVRHLLLANEIGSARNARRIAELQERTDVTVCVDSDTGARLLEKAAAKVGVTIPVLVEVDIGLARAGLLPGAGLVALGRHIAKASHLRLAGIMGYEGHTLDLPEAIKQSAVEEAIATLIEARDLLRGHDLDIDIVSCGGTGSYRIASRIAGVTEVQAGGGCFGDLYYTDRCGVSWVEPALVVIATITSRPTRERAITDAGAKAMSNDQGLPASRVGGVTVVGLHAEHGILRLEDDAQSLRVGDRIAFVPGYSDSTTVLHGGFIAVRGGTVVDILVRPVRWPD